MQEWCNSHSVLVVVALTVVELILATVIMFPVVIQS